jgi:hypothetical protein
MSNIEVSDEIRSNFHRFWDNFPFPVMLVHKDRTIIEANEAGAKLGCPVGTRCVDIGEKSYHAGCRANVALREQAGVREVGYHEHMGQVIDSYWVPLAGSDDLYVHFGIDITQYAAGRFFPNKQRHGGCGCDSHAHSHE